MDVYVGALWRGDSAAAAAAAQKCQGVRSYTVYFSSTGGPV